MLCWFMSACSLLTVTFLATEKQNVIMRRNSPNECRINTMLSSILCMHIIVLLLNLAYAVKDNGIASMLYPYIPIWSTPRRQTYIPKRSTPRCKDSCIYSFFHIQFLPHDTPLECSTVRHHMLGQSSFHLDHSIILFLTIRLSPVCNLNLHNTCTYHLPVPFY